MVLRELPRIYLPPAPAINQLGILPYEGEDDPIFNAMDARPRIQEIANNTVNLEDDSIFSGVSFSEETANSPLERSKTLPLQFFLAAQPTGGRFLSIRSNSSRLFWRIG